jgi:hypothetical protein
MSLTNITNTTTVYLSGALTSSTGYNEILNVVNLILKNDYGYQGAAAHEVNAGENIRAEEWNSLITDIDVIRRHQLNQQFSTTPVPTPGNVVLASTVNTIIAAVNDADQRKYNRPPAEQRSLTSFYSNTGTSTIWPTTLTHTLELTWDPNDPNPTLGRKEFDHYFKLGGRVSFDLSCVPSTATNNVFWNDFITASRSGINSFVFDYSSLSNLVNDIDPAYRSTSTTFTNGSNSIKLSVLVPQPAQRKKLIASVSLTNDKIGVNLNTTSTITTEYSTNAIFAPIPAFNVTKNFGDDYVPVFEAKESLNITVPATFEMRSGSTSTEQTITIRNTGNTTTTIKSYGVTVVSNTPGLPVTPTLNYSWDITQPRSLAVGAEVTIRLYYYGDNVTTTSYGNGELTVNLVETPSANPSVYTIRLSKVVKPKLFSFTLSPAFISYSTSSSAVLEQKFTIVPSDGTYTAQPAVSLVPNAAYTLSKQEFNGPTVQFNTSTNGTYTTVLSVVVTGTNAINEITTATVTAPISIYRNAPTTENLGTWTSALQPFNGIIGASYDVIDGKRYVTLGFGMGADGSLSLGNDPTGASAFVEFLGTNTTTLIVDSKYALGNPPLYAGNNDSAYTPFLKSTTNVGGYGVWIRPSSYQDAEGGRFGPVGIYVERTYKFIVSTSGLHTWTMSSDNESYFTVDGALVGDLRNVGRDQSYKREYTGSINLTAGEHTLTFYVINTNGPAAIALRIVDPASLEVWSTRFPIRIGSVYQNWQEVYRIPLTGSAQSYQCNDTYCIKNSNNVNGQRWGYYFGSAGSTANSMFTVTDDGIGNITIALNPVNVNSAEILALDSNDRTTIISSSHLFYYYSNIRTNNQYTQLTPAPAADGTTQYFTGFTHDGTVRTTNVIPPTDPTNTVVAPIDSGSTGSSDINIYYNEQ